jgi:predicted deacetylase
MQPPDAAVAIAVHDVSPATWRECRELLSMLDHTGAHPVSLLVIPQYHHRASVLADRPFRKAMEARLALGDELVLHGMFHVDDEPPPRTLRGLVERRLLTRSEGEFASLAAPAAAQRIAAGVAMFTTLRWPLYGFVPPAWLISTPARAALVQCGYPFRYMTVRGGVYRLPEWRFERTANLCYSPGNAMRRAYSRLAISHELRRAHDVPLLRLSLHPQDVGAPGVLRHWQRLIADALAHRRPVTKCQWAASFSPPQRPEHRTPTDAQAVDAVGPARAARAAS